MTISEVKADLVDALGALDKTGMGLDELKACADTLRTVAEVPETASMDVLTETMLAMREAMRSAAESLTRPAGPVGYGVAM